MLVDLLRGGDMRMSQNELGISGRYTEIFKQRRSGMPNMVDGTEPDTMLFTDSTE